MLLYICKRQSDNARSKSRAHVPRASLRCTPLACQLPVRFSNGRDGNLKPNPLSFSVSGPRSCGCSPCGPALTPHHMLAVLKHGIGRYSLGF